MRNVFAKTTNVAAFSAAMNRLQNRQTGVPGLAVAFGEPGLGKTRTAIWWTAGNANTVYLRATELMTPRWFLGELASELKEEPEKRTKELFQQCVRALIEQPRTILVDETDLLLHDPRMIEMLRSIHDKSGAPIVMMGMGGLDRKLARHKHVYDRFAEIVQFRELSQADVRGVAEQLCEVKISADACEFIHTQAKRLRQVVMWLYKVENLARTNSLKEVTAANLGSIK